MLPVAIIKFFLSENLLCSPRMSLDSSLVVIALRPVCAAGVEPQRIRPRVTKEMDGRWMFGWLSDSAAVSQAALSTGETRQRQGGWMKGESLD